MWPFGPSYREAVEAKQAERTKALSAAPTEIAGTTEDPAILAATATEIVLNIETGTWTAAQVVEAFIMRAAFAQEATNCLTEVMFVQARERAKQLDADFASTGRLRGPLHGVPVSFKDQFDIENFDSSIGFSTWTNKPATKNADLVQQFIDAGAVIITKTNVPQTMLAFECSNPVFGRSTNPYNNKYTPGGSSGGEAALLAMDGAAVGIGSDVGGSLRIPAGYCGIYSLKPSHGRISSTGARGPVPGFEGIRTVVGPMGRSVKDLELVCKTVFGSQSPINHDVAPLLFREISLQAKLRFGYYTSDGYVKASPACKRAVLETVAALRKQGHECIEVEVPSILDSFNVFVGMTAADGYKTLTSHLGPDPKEESLFLATLGPKLPGFLRLLAIWVIRTFIKDRTFAGTLAAAKVSTMGEYMKLVAARNEYTRLFQVQVWQQHAIDGIIAPVQALPQLPHGGCANFSALAVSTVLYNVLDAAVGCVPVTRVDPSKDQLTNEWLIGPGLGSSIFESGIYRGKSPLYDPVATEGMPVCVQVAGRKWEDEKVLAMMKVVDDALGKERGFGPGSWDRRDIKSLTTNN
ncbi:amidase signature enzyme [Pluteus cervinus]|uniref:Amidase signature enzyme n=1 Tax=Pluteus cervinus TaxID=181527 RepID=A0ACD3B124_9AGAR|nr:amidase signature enzyme [Pluteus cervinus]